MATFGNTATPTGGTFYMLNNIKNAASKFHLSDTALITGIHFYARGYSGSGKPATRMRGCIWTLGGSLVASTGDIGVDTNFGWRFGSVSGSPILQPGDYYVGFWWGDDKDAQFQAEASGADGSIGKVSYNASSGSTTAPGAFTSPSVNNGVLGVAAYADYQPGNFHLKRGSFGAAPLNVKRGSFGAGIVYLKRGTFQPGQ